MIAEIKLQKNYLREEKITTIYFGGGTPSILSTEETDSLLDIVFKNFQVDKNAEISFECNPDDLSAKKLSDLFKLGINRISIGIQSFNNEHLEFLHRTHDSRTAVESYKRARQAGFSNISIDLIYGISSPNHQIWIKDLSQAIHLSPEHISAYCLTIEPNTVFGNWTSKGKLKLPDEEFSAEQLEMTMRILGDAGYEQYEISNFARPGFYSRHNSAYWLNKRYLGVGPGAHSYDGTSRQYNVRNNHKYIRALSNGVVPFQKEVLSQKDRANEFLMTRLRTQRGCDLKTLKSKYDYDLMSVAAKKIRWLIDQNYLLKKGTIIALTQRGRLLTDQITADLFWI